MQVVSINCSLDTLEVGPLRLEANPDIAGVGVCIITVTFSPLRVNAEIEQVLIGFTFSAVMTLVLVVIHYIFEEHHTENLVDRAWIELLNRKCFSEISILTREKWIKATTSALLTYSDQQAITGITILLAGYLQLSNGIQVYHWQVLTNLAWFSSVTHIATLTSLRVYFKKRPKLAYCRITAMGINLILLGVASGPANYQIDTTQFYAFPAKCLYQQLHGRSENMPELNSLMLAVSLVFLVTSYTIRVIRISVTCSRVTHDLLRVKLGNWMKRNHSKAANYQATSQNAAEKKLWCLRKQQLTLIYVIFKALCEAGDSMLWEIIWLLAALGFGITKLVLRQTEVNLDEEHVWGFGQIVSVFLSILPMWSIFGAIYEIREMEPITLDLEASTLEETETNPFSVAFSSPEVFESQWFRNILILMFIIAVFQIADFLYILILGIAQKNDYTATALIDFFIQLAMCTGVIIISAAIGLYFHFHSLPFFSNLSIHSKRKLGLRLWALWILFITAGLIVFVLFF